MHNSKKKFGGRWKNCISLAAMGAKVIVGHSKGTWSPKAKKHYTMKNRKRWLWDENNCTKPETLNAATCEMKSQDKLTSGFSVPVCLTPTVLIISFSNTNREAAVFQLDRFSVTWRSRACLNFSVFFVFFFWGLMSVQTSCANRGQWKPVPPQFSGQLVQLELQLHLVVAL